MRYFQKIIIFLRSPDLTLTVNQIKLYDDEQTINRLWLKNMPLKVIIHGWQSSAENTPGVFDITKGNYLTEGLTGRYPCLHYIKRYY